MNINRSHYGPLFQVERSAYCHVGSRDGWGFKAGHG